MPGRVRRIIEWPGRLAWRWFTGKELDGVPRTDAGWFRPGRTTLDIAPRPPETLGAEIRGDLRQFRAERRERRAQRDARQDLQTAFTLKRVYVFTCALTCVRLVL